jgi:hypothetical protein
LTRNSNADRLLVRQTSLNLRKLHSVMAKRDQLTKQKSSHNA